MASSRTSPAARSASCSPAATWTWSASAAWSPGSTETSPPPAASKRWAGVPLLDCAPMETHVGTSEESLLLAGLRSGDQDAYARLVKQHGGRLLEVSRRLL